MFSRIKNLSYKNAINKLLQDGIASKIAALYLVIYILPFVVVPLIYDGTGRLDWIQVIQRYAAIHETIIHYGQMPGNNIWLGGGMPLTQTYAAYGIFGICTLFLGPEVGVHIALGLYYFIGYFGALKWAQLITKDRLNQILFSLYFIMGNAITYHIAAGHIIFVTIMMLPGIMYLTNQADKKNYGIYAGILLGLAALDGLLYSTQYLILAMFVYWTSGILNKRVTKKAALTFMLGVLMGFVSIALYKIYTIFPMISAFPREMRDGTNYQLIDAIRFTLLPNTQLTWTDINAKYCTATWENGNYIGISAAMLIIAASFKWTKATFGILLLILASFSNSNNWYEINYYIKMIPGFSSHLCTARLRLLLPFFIGTVIVVYIQNIKSPKEIKKYTILFFISVLELTAVNAPIMIGSHAYESRIDKESEEKVSSFEKENRLSIIKTYNELPDGVKNIAEATERNIGIFNQQESYIPPINYENFSNISQSPEFTQGNKEVIPGYWSPNKIIFNNLVESECLNTKIHISKYWMINNMNLYKNRSIYEPDELICAFPDKNGSLVLEYVIPHSHFIIFVNILLLILVIIRLNSELSRNLTMKMSHNK